MNEQETQQLKRDILEKYRGRIDGTDFRVLTDGLPSPSELQQDGSYLEFLGPMRGKGVWLKRSVVFLGALGAGIIYIGELTQGVEEVRHIAEVAYDKLPAITLYATEHQDDPADEYAIAFPPGEFYPPPPPPPPAPLDSPTSVASTTTTPDPFDLPPGSGLAPFSWNWS